MTADQPSGDVADEVLLERVAEADKARAQALEQQEAATSALRARIMEAGQAHPKRQGWPTQITRSVKSLSYRLVSETLGVGQQIADAKQALLEAGIGPDLFKLGPGTPGQVVLSLTPKSDGANTRRLAEKFLAALLAVGLTLAPTSVRSPERSAEEKQAALDALAVIGTAVAVIDARAPRKGGHRTST